MNFLEREQYRHSACSHTLSPASCAFQRLWWTHLRKAWGAGWGKRKGVVTAAFLPFWTCLGKKGSNRAKFPAASNSGDSGMRNGQRACGAAASTQLPVPEQRERAKVPACSSHQRPQHMKSQWGADGGYSSSLLLFYGSRWSSCPATFSKPGWPQSWEGTGLFPLAPILLVSEVYKHSFPSPPPQKKLSQEDFYLVWVGLFFSCNCHFWSWRKNLNMYRHVQNGDSPGKKWMFVHSGHIYMWN